MDDIRKENVLLRQGLSDSLETISQLRKENEVNETTSIKIWVCLNFLLTTPTSHLFMLFCT